MRRAKLRRLEEVVEHPVIVYATNFLNSLKVQQVGGDELQINLRDKTGFIEATNHLATGPLDVLLHSPGGSPTATESIVAMLRQKFDPIRFIIPDVAKSAATMLAMSGDEILMTPSGELGPIDPQMVLSREGRTIIAPAQAILDQFEQASKDLLTSAARLPVWLPILREYGPSLLQDSSNAIALSKQLVGEWLARYMFRNQPDASQRAQIVVDYLGGHNNFKSHGRRIGAEHLQQLGVGVQIQTIPPGPLLTAVMDAYWSVDVTFDLSGAYKIIEHHSGNAFIQSIQMIVTQGLQQPALPAPQLPPPLPANRAERRRQGR